MHTTENKLRSKIKGTPLGKLNGLTFYGKVIMPKRKGKDLHAKHP